MTYLYQVRLSSRRRPQKHQPWDATQVFRGQGHFLALCPGEFPSLDTCQLRLVPERIRRPQEQVVRSHSQQLQKDLMVTPAGVVWFPNYLLLLQIIFGFRSLSLEVIQSCCWLGHLSALSVTGEDTRTTKASSPQSLSTASKGFQGWPSRCCYFYDVRVCVFVFWRFSPGTSAWSHFNM